MFVYNVLFNLFHRVIKNYNYVYVITSFTWNITQCQKSVRLVLVYLPKYFNAVLWLPLQK